MKKEDLFDTLGDIDNQYIMEAHMKNRRKYNYTWVRCGIMVACFALLVFCIFMVKNLSTEKDDNYSEYLYNDKDEPDNIQENQVMSEEVQVRIDELNLGDKIGWIVYDGRIYIQNIKMDTISLEGEQSNIELGSCVGKASEFIGAYNNNSDVCDGDVYVVVNNPDIMCIKLNNGATIWLKVGDLKSFKGY